MGAASLSSKDEVAVSGIGTVKGVYSPKVTLTTTDPYAEKFLIANKGLIAVLLKGAPHGTTGKFQISHEVDPDETTDDDWDDAEDNLGSAIEVTGSGSTEVVVQALLGAPALWGRWKITGGDSSTSMKGYITTSVVA